MPSEPKGALFRTIGRGTGVLTTTRLTQSEAHAMICRRAAAAGIVTTIGNHTFRATGIPVNCLAPLTFASKSRKMQY